MALKGLNLCPSARFCLEPDWRAPRFFFLLVNNTCMLQETASFLSVSFPASRARVVGLFAPGMRIPLVDLRVYFLFFFFSLFFFFF